MLTKHFQSTLPSECAYSHSRTSRDRSVRMLCAHTLYYKAKYSQAEVPAYEASQRTFLADQLLAHDQ